MILERIWMRSPRGYMLQPVRSFVATVALLVHHSLIVDTVDGACGNPPYWMPWPGNWSYLSYGAIAPCIANNGQGYPVPGTVVTRNVTHANMTTATVTSCVAASPFHATFNSTTFKVLRYPFASLGDRAVTVGLHNAAVGLRSIKEPQCAVRADGGNLTLVDPASGPLYVGLPSGTTSSHPGAYANGVGIRNGWMASTWNRWIYILTLRKNLTQTTNKKNDFACYEGFGATGTLFKTFTVTGSRTNCITACLGNTNCTMVTVGQNATSSSSSVNDYNLLSAKSKLFLRVPIVCQLYRGGVFIGSASANLTVCTKLVD